VRAASSEPIDQFGASVRIPSGNPYRAPGILDQYGNPYRAPIDPLKKADKGHASRVFRDLAQSPPIQWSWTPVAIREALTEHALGMFQRSAKLIQEMGTHARISSSLSSRVEALLGLAEVFEAGEADTDTECLAAWKEAWPKCRSPIDQGDTVDPIRKEALMAGFTVCEIVWDTEVTPWQPYLKPWPLESVYRDHGNRRLMAMTEEGPEVITPGDGRWFVHAPSGIYSGHLNGLVRPLALPWLLDSLACRDWARYSERHGMPILKAIVPAMASADSKERFESDLETMGSEAIALLPQGLDGEGFDLELLEAAANTWEGFDRLHIRCESTITIAVQWQNLTTEVKEGGMNAARVHADVKQSAVCFDDRVWTNDVHQQIARPFALWNYGDVRKAPKTRRDLEVLEDKLQNVMALDAFSRALASLRQSGDPVDVEALARAYRVKLPMGSARMTQPTIYAYHLAAGVVRRDEMRDRLGLPPVGGEEGQAFLGGATTAEGSGDAPEAK
jgi:phage gp29-like protein